MFKTEVEKAIELAIDGSTDNVRYWINAGKRDMESLQLINNNVEYTYKVTIKINEVDTITFQVNAENKNGTYNRAKDKRQIYKLIKMLVLTLNYE